jgi:hypothetical protein
LALPIVAVVRAHVLDEHVAKEERYAAHGEFECEVDGVTQEVHAQPGRTEPKDELQKLES